MRTIPGKCADPRPATAAAAAAPVVAPQPNPAAAILDDPITAGVLHSAWSGDPAVVVPSPPGAGKTRLVALLAAALSTRADLRVGIAAQTRDQAAEIARRLAAMSCRARLMWPAKQPSPDLGAEGAGMVVRGRAACFPDSGGGVLIGTTARWTFANPDVLVCDLMIVDEAWQATYADLGALGAFAAQVVCVGDPGQIDPVVTGCTRRWQDSPTAPHLPAPVALRAAHGDAVSMVTMRHTWRLGPATTAMIQPAFYPDLPFTSRRPPEHLQVGAAPLAEVAPVLQPAAAGPGDPVLTAACAGRVHELLDSVLVTGDGARPVTPADIAVVTAHVSQAAAVRAMLADLPAVLVGTANQLQGMERPAAVVLHPLAGYRDPSAFGTDLGRACVMFSRHRAHLSVVIDPATADVLQVPDPPAEVVGHSRLLASLLAV